MSNTAVSWIAHMRTLTDVCHGHVYFDEGSLEQAHALYEQLTRELKEFALGRIHKLWVLIHADNSKFWCRPSRLLTRCNGSINRLGLTVFWHPVIDDDLYAIQMRHFG